MIQPRFQIDRRRIVFWLVGPPAGLGIIVTIGVLTTIAALCASAIRTNIQIGLDEHFEITKALLWARGHALYSEVWNDQPPLFTVVLGTAFKTFGATIGVARSIACVFGVVFLSACWLISRTVSGTMTACFSLGFLITAPVVFQITIAPMLEIPAFGIALLAALPVIWSKGPISVPSLALSGVTFAIALQIKLTSALMVPALLIHFVLNSRNGPQPLKFSAVFRRLAFWIAVTLIATLLLGSIAGSGYQQAWSSHFGPVLSAQVHPERAHAFSFWKLLEHWDASLAAGIGLLLVICKRDFTRLAFPCVWLATVAMVHWLHRPWWNYYYIHFAVPLSWLAGHAVSELFRRALDTAWKWNGREAYIGLFSLILGMSLSAMLVVHGGERLAVEVDDIRNAEKVEQSRLIRKMREFAGQTKWVYTQSTEYAFHAGFMVPPELAVLPLKRFWSGQISNSEVWAKVQQYEPEQILLPCDIHLEQPQVEYLGRCYSVIYDDNHYKLFAIKALVPK